MAVDFSRHGGIYAGMKFPEFQFQEFPKWLTNKAGKRVLVKSTREELQLASELPPEDVVDAVVKERDDLAKQNDELRAQLAALAAKTDAPSAPTTASTAGLDSLMAKAKPAKN